LHKGISYVMKSNDSRIIQEREFNIFVVSHCPTSNICILSGLCHVRNLMNAGVPVGLGTDVSGGYSSSIIEAMRHAIITSKVIAMKDPNYKPLDFKDVFYLATLGGSQGYWKMKLKLILL